MGSEGETNAGKPRYNISMSRRTRKPRNLNEGSDHEEKDKESFIISTEKKQKSLKQLIEGRCPLEQLFREEEKQLSVVVKPPDQDGCEGVRLKRSTMRNYVKVLSHLIKVKQESYIRSWRKSALSLKLIEHK